MNRQSLKSLLISTLVVAAVAFGSSVTIPYTFSAGTTARASEVNANFAALKTSVDDNDARISALEAAAVVPPWTSVTFQNGFSDCDPANFQPTAYFKDSNGVVHLRGLAKRASAALSTAIFTLPPGYRPAKRAAFAVIADQNVARLEINASGLVYIEFAASASWYNFFFLDGVTFDTR